MRYFTSLLFTAAISSLASAQQNYTIDPDSVDITTRGMSNLGSSASLDSILTDHRCMVQLSD